MPSNRRLTPARRDLVLIVVALGLLTAPVWVTQLPVGGPVYQYERAEVTTNGTAIEYATMTDSISGPISDEIACSDSLEARPCALERVVLDNTTVPTGIYASNPGDTRPPIDERYRYVRIDGAVYERRTLPTVRHSGKTACIASSWLWSGPSPIRRWKP